MVVGAYAVFVHGEPRTSLDVDVVIAIPPSRREEVRAALAGTELTSLFWAEDPVWGRRYRCFDRDGILVELFLTATTALHEREFRRRVLRSIEGQPIWFISPEDLVLRKLVNCRLRKKLDFSDAVSVLQLQGDSFDHGYVRHHCAVHRVCELYELAMREASKRESADTA